MTTLIAYPPAKLDSKYVIPSTVKTIAGDAFRGNEKLQVVVIGNSVSSIGPSAFRNCTNLKTVYFGIGLETIHPYAFLDSGVEKMYYAGTEKQWIVDVNCAEDELYRAERIFNYRVEE